MRRQSGQRQNSSSKPILHIQILFMELSCSLRLRELRKVPAICILIRQGEKIRKRNRAEIHPATFLSFARLHVANVTRSKYLKVFQLCVVHKFCKWGVFCTVCVIVFVFKRSVHPKIKTHVMKAKKGEILKKVQYNTCNIFKVFLKPYDFFKGTERNLTLFTKSLDILAFLSSSHKSS